MNLVNIIGNTKEQQKIEDKKLRDKGSLWEIPILDKFVFKPIELKLLKYKEQKMIQARQEYESYKRRLDKKLSSYA